MQIIRMQYNEGQTHVQAIDADGKPYHLPCPCYTWHNELVDEFRKNGGKIEPYTPPQPYWLNGEKFLLEFPAELPEGASFEKPHEVAAQEERVLRDELLSASDWAVLPDAPLTDVEKQEWKVYRQALRDIPQQSGFPEFVIVPEAPVKVTG